MLNLNVLYVIFYIKSINSVYFYNINIFLELKFEYLITDLN